MGLKDSRLPLACAQARLLVLRCTTLVAILRHRGTADQPFHRFRSKLAGTGGRSYELQLLFACIGIDFSSGRCDTRLTSRPPLARDFPGLDCANLGKLDRVVRFSVFGLRRPQTFKAFLTDFRVSLCVQLSSVPVVKITVALTMLIFAIFGS